MELHLHEAAPGAGPGSRSVAFVHGLFGQGKNFTAIAKALARRDPTLRIGLVDLPNHGRSPWTDSINYRDMADLVAEALREWSPGTPVILVGHSMGGRTVMQVALHHPDVVEKLVVVDVSPVDGDSSEGEFRHLIGALRHIDLAHLDSRQEAEQVVAPFIRDERVRSFLLQNLRRGPGTQASPEGQVAAWHWQCNLDLLESDLAQVGSWPQDEDARWEGPVVWIRGAESDYVQPRHRPAMEALFPHARLVTVKGAGHWVHSEQPEAFVDIIDHVIHADPTPPRSVH